MKAPFTYSLYNKSTGLYYYGARWAKKADPDQLWVSYFTSSKHVHALIEKYGADDFVVKVRKIFDDPHDARRWEEKFLCRVQAAQSPKWINKHNGGTHFFTISGADHPSKRPEFRAMMSKVQKGRMRSDEWKTRVSKQWLGVPKSAEHNRKNSEANKGKPKHSTAQKEKWSRDRSGTNAAGENPRAKRIKVDELIFDCITSAAKFFKVSRSTFRNKFKYVVIDKRCDHQLLQPTAENLPSTETHS